MVNIKELENLYFKYQYKVEDPYNVPRVQAMIMDFVDIFLFYNVEIVSIDPDFDGGVVKYILKINIENLIRNLEHDDLETDDVIVAIDQLMEYYFICIDNYHVIEDFDIRSDEDIEYVGTSFMHYLMKMVKENKQSLITKESFIDFLNNKDIEEKE